MVDVRLSLRSTTFIPIQCQPSLALKIIDPTGIQIPGKAHTGAIDRLPMHASQTEIYISFAGLREMRVEKRSQRSSNLLHSSWFHGRRVRAKASHHLALSNRSPQTNRTVIPGFYSSIFLEVAIQYPKFCRIIIRSDIEHMHIFDVSTGDYRVPIRSDLR